jgi:hypothetical protein
LAASSTLFKSSAIRSKNMAPPVMEYPMKMCLRDKGMMLKKSKAKIIKKS